MCQFRLCRMPWWDTIRAQHRITPVLDQLITPARIPLMFDSAA